MAAKLTRWVCSTVAAIVVGTALGAVPAMADDPHHPLSGPDLLQSCVHGLNTNALPLDRVITGLPNWDLVPSYNDPSQSECANFGWAGFSVRTGPFTVTPTFSGPNINTSAWDCNHSSVTYGLYRWNRVTNLWSFVGGGVMYGNLAGGVCGHSVNNFPSQASWGRDSLTSYSTPNISRFRIAVQSWSHNDTNIGHPGNLCADRVDCLWDTRVAVALS